MSTTTSTLSTRNRTSFTNTTLVCTYHRRVIALSNRHIRGLEASAISSSGVISLPYEGKRFEFYSCDYRDTPSRNSVEDSAARNRVPSRTEAKPASTTFTKHNGTCKIVLQRALHSVPSWSLAAEQLRDKQNYSRLINISVQEQPNTKNPITAHYGK